MDWDAFYKSVGQPMKLVGSSSTSSPGTVDAVNPLDGWRLGLGMGNGEAPAKPFSELASGTGWGGLLGILGIGANYVTGNKDASAPIIEAGPEGVAANPATVLGVDFGHGLSRVSIIVLGFIFVAVGLSMFKSE